MTINCLSFFSHVLVIYLSEYTIDDYEAERNCTHCNSLLVSLTRRHKALALWHLSDVDIAAAATTGLRNQLKRVSEDWFMHRGHYNAWDGLRYTASATREWVEICRQTTRLSGRNTWHIIELPRASCLPSSQLLPDLPCTSPKSGLPSAIALDVYIAGHLSFSCGVQRPCRQLEAQLFPCRDVIAGRTTDPSFHRRARLASSRPPVTSLCSHLSRRKLCKFHFRSFLFSVFSRDIYYYRDVLVDPRNLVHQTQYWYSHEWVDYYTKSLSKSMRKSATYYEL